MLCARVCVLFNVSTIAALFVAAVALDNVYMPACGGGGHGAYISLNNSREITGHAGTLCTRLRHPYPNSMP